MPNVTVGQLKNKLKNLKQQFRNYREAVGKTGNPHVKMPNYYDSLFEIYGERPLDQPHTVSCGLSPPNDRGHQSHEEAEEEEPEAVAEINIPNPPRPPAKRRKLGGLTHGEKMEELHKKILEEIREQGRREMENQREIKEILKTYKDVQEKRNDILMKIFNIDDA